MNRHDEDEAEHRAANMRYRGFEVDYRPDARLIDIAHNAGGFTVHGRPTYVTRADRRRSGIGGMVVAWAMSNRPDVLTPLQRDALELYYGPVHNALDEAVWHCVDEDGHALAGPPAGPSPVSVWASENGHDPEETTWSEIPADVQDAHETWMEDVLLLREARCGMHDHVQGPLSQSQAARYLDISVGAFRDRLQRAERNATDAWNYDRLRRGRKPIPDVLTKYRRRRAKTGRAST